MSKNRFRIKISTITAVLVLIMVSLIICSCGDNKKQTLCEQGRGIVINSVYGTGDNTDTVIKNGFVQLRNTTGNTVSLDGLSLYYSEDGKKYKSIKLSGEIEDYYLIRSASYKGKGDSVTEVITLDSYDIETKRLFDNKKLSFILAPGGLSAKKLSEYTIDSFTTLEDKDGNRTPDCSLTKNKMALRRVTNGREYYDVYDLTMMNAEKLSMLCPSSSSGSNTVRRTAFNTVLFSESAGFYDKPFTLTLSDYEGWDIYYTLDGSDPTNSNASKYEDGIKLSYTDTKGAGETTRKTQELMGDSYRIRAGENIGGYPVRAYATNGKEQTEVVTSTYFIIPNFTTTFNVTVMNMSLNVDDFVGTENGAYYTYQYDLWSTRPRSTAYLEVFNKSGNRVGHSYIEFAVSGNGSSGQPMKSLRLYWKDSLNKKTYNDLSLEYDLFDGRARDNKGNIITSFTRILLRNGGNDYRESYIRDAYCQRLSTGFNVDTMASVDTILFVNGELWGVYNCRERYSAEYFASHYGVDPDNVVVIENISPLANNSWNSDYVLAQGNEGDEKDFLNLVRFVKGHDLSIDDNYRIVEDWLDLDSYIDYWISSCYFVNHDWPGNNIKVWRNKNKDDPSGMDTKWRYCLLDMDFCVGLSSNASDGMLANANSGTINGAIMEKLLQNDEFKERYAKRAYYLAVNYFDTDEAIDELYRMSESKRKFMGIQVNRWGGTIENFDKNISNIEYFMNRRFKSFYKDVLRHTQTSDSWICDNCDVNVKVNFDSALFNVTVNGKPIPNSGYVSVITADKRNLEIKVECLTEQACTYIKFAGITGSSSSAIPSEGKLTVEESGTLTIQ